MPENRLFNYDPRIEADLVVVSVKPVFVAPFRHSWIPEAVLPTKVAHHQSFRLSALQQFQPAQSRIQILKLLDPMSIILILFYEDSGFGIVQSFKVIEHDCHRQIQQEVAADYNESHKENGGEEEAVPVLHHLHDLGPPFQSSALKNG